MRVTFWGTRGSIAKPGPTTVRYGGNTSCVEVETDGGTRIIVDCGTGAHGLGHDLLARYGDKPIDGHLLITHTHWDHIQGLPFFAPLFRSGGTWHIYGPRGLGGSILDTLAGQMQYAYSPITLEEMQANVDYHDLVDGVIEVGDATVVTEYLNHPALSLGYRIEADGATVVYASDHEPNDPRLASGGDVSTSPADAGHLRFLAGADLVIHDAQYIASEYAEKGGWGHSTVEYAVDVAVQAGVAHLALYHHDPMRTDDQVDEVVALARQRVVETGASTVVSAAVEGESLTPVAGAGRATEGRPDRAHAKRQPALDTTPHSILLAVEDPEVARVVRDAAEAEELTIWEGASEDVVHLADEHRPAIVVLGDGDDADRLATDIRDLDVDYGTDVTIVTVAPSGRDRTRSSAITDWLPWPFSAVYARTRMNASLLRRACRWQRPPIPDDEERRLRSLHDLDILDTGSERRFDDLTQEASDTLGVPVALVSLVDRDRQWFKSAHGLDADETPREVSFCAHAIVGEGVFQIPDAMGDDRFADNPLVTGDPRIRFYAGVPLELSDGSSVGTLCVIDYKPRVLGADDLDVLRNLGRRVVEELETSS